MIIELNKLNKVNIEFLTDDVNIYSIQAIYENNKKKPVSIDFLKSILSMFNETDNLKINCNHPINRIILKASFNSVYKNLIWICESKERPFHFIKNNKKETVNLIFPNLIFQLNKDKIHVYGLKHKFNRLNIMNEFLYAIPFPNIYSDQSLCTGNNKELTISSNFDISEIINKIESIFFNSYFNSDLSISNSATSILTKNINHKKPIPLKYFKKINTVKKCFF